MARRHIRLEVTIRAVVQGGDEYIPESTAAYDTVTVDIPGMDKRFVVFPKVIEGATQNVIAELHANVGSYLNKKDLEERRRKEFEQMQMTYPRINDDESDDDDPFDEDAEAEDDSEDEDAEAEDDEDAEGDSEQPQNGGLIDFAKVAANVEAALQNGGE